MINKNIPHSNEYAIHHFLDGEAKLAEIHQEREKEKLGHLRIGSAGCMISEDACIGKCPQTALARFVGYQLPTDSSTGFFQGGTANEATWETMITAAGLDYKSEEDIPILHTFPDGTLLTGRPDMVLGTEADILNGEYAAFIPRLMIELKACQATNSAAQKILLEKPATDHLIQAATYSMFLGVPASLVYTGNVSGGISNYFTRREVGQNDMSFGKIEFNLGWDQGNLYYMKGKHRIDTIVTQQGILDYFQNISKMAREGNPNMIYQDMVDIEGNMLPFDARKYNDILNLVDSNLPMDEWKEKLAIVTKQPYQIKYKTKRGHNPWYEVIHPDYVVEEHRYYRQDKVIKKFEMLRSARRFIYEGGK